MLKPRRHPMNDFDHRVPLGHCQRSAGTEIVLHIDHDQNIVRRYLHGDIEPSKEVIGSENRRGFAAISRFPDSQQYFSFAFEVGMSIFELGKEFSCWPNLTLLRVRQPLLNAFRGINLIQHALLFKKAIGTGTAESRFALSAHASSSSLDRR
jgi:hypothetical protein